MAEWRVPKCGQTADGRTHTNTKLGSEGDSAIGGNYGNKTKLFQNMDFMLRLLACALYMLHAALIYLVRKLETNAHAHPRVLRGFSYSIPSMFRFFLSLFPSKDSSIHCPEARSRIGRLLNRISPPRLPFAETLYSLVGVSTMGTFATERVAAQTKHFLHLICSNFP